MSDERKIIIMIIDKQANSKITVLDYKKFRRRKALYDIMFIYIVKITNHRLSL